ncbi:hypothetical protein PHMEG_0005300 [Phytophthora megakarya]|uniref:Uncharacterized protein n=1 Tax=Phytophthora megakarya TaxID=4795 RepID=A0A225WRU5_9STRA|nr:hypothetical protein PHMEG_0005300 [Phytophthora megakarya]
MEGGMEFAEPAEAKDATTTKVTVEAKETARKRRTSEPAKTPRRGVLQEDSVREEETSDEDANDDGSTDTYEIPGYAIDTDPNLMPRGADQCAGFKSVEDPDLHEEPTEEEDGGDTDSCDRDWDIGALTDDESDKKFADLPASVWLSAAKDKELISSMRHDGWEYDSTTFGSDSTYAALSEEVFGPSDSVLSVMEDPLLFYILPPKLWSQIAVESNRYHTQSVLLRARILSGGEIEVIGEIHRRLACVADIEVWEVLRVIGCEDAGADSQRIAAHWSTKKVGVLQANCFGLFMANSRFFHFMVFLHFSNNTSPQATMDRA